MNGPNSMRGISFTEILIVFALVSVMLGTTLPDGQGYAIRTNVDHSLAVLPSAQKALMDACDANHRAVVTSNIEADFHYLPSNSAADHVSRIELGADCGSQNMAVVVWTSHTGAETDPVIEWIAVPENPYEKSHDKQVYSWSCNLISGDEQHVPEACRARSRDS